MILFHSILNTVPETKHFLIVESTTGWISLELYHNLPFPQCYKVWIDFGGYGNMEPKTDCDSGQFFFSHVKILIQSKFKAVSSHFPKMFMVLPLWSYLAALFEAFCQIYIIYLI